MIQQAKAAGCKDCGGVFPSDKLHFDHLPGFVKLFHIGYWGGHGIEQVREEISKCEVVCEACHKKRTATRRQNAQGVGLSGFTIQPELF